MPRKPIRVIFFDVGGTILTVRPSVGDIYAAAALRLGCAVDPCDVNRLFGLAWESSRKRRELANYECSDSILRTEWRRIVLDSFAGLLPETIAERAFEDLYERFCRADAWSVADRAEETFQRLRARGFTLGLLSNWDSRLEETLAAVDLLEHFAPHLRIVSHAVGVEKPHAAMFREAIRATTTTSDEILHVGDSLDWDIRPARSAGLETLWVRSPRGAASDDTEDTGLDVDSFAEVLDVIEDRFVARPRTTPTTMPAGSRRSVTEKKESPRGA